jgi:hypothetical protein
LPPPAALATRELGTAVVEHRTSWVRRLPTALGDIYVKNYEYATWASRLRDFGRRTGPFATGRARREFAALAWLHQHGFEAPQPVAVFERRRLGWLVQATLVTAAWPGQPATIALAGLSPDRRQQLAAAIGQLLHRLHRLGFRDRNFDLRNLLVQPRGDDFAIAKIDSPRWCLRRSGAAPDRLSRADWRRLLPQLATFGVADAALRTQP